MLAKRMSLLLTTLVLWLAPVRTDANELMEQLIALEVERHQAYVSGNLDVVEHQLAREYVHTNLNGGRTTREQELAF